MTWSLDVIKSTFALWQTEYFVLGVDHEERGGNHPHKEF